MGIQFGVCISDMIIDMQSVDCGVCTKAITVHSRLDEINLAYHTVTIYVSGAAYQEPWNVNLEYLHSV